MRIAVLLAVLAISAPAAAQEQAAAGRFAFVPVEAGALRLDRETGAVSLCTGGSGELACKPVPDAARPAAAGQAGLAEPFAALEARVAALEARDPAGIAGVTDDETLDRVALLADKVMRRFFGLVRDMKREMEEEEL